MANVLILIALLAPGIVAGGYYLKITGQRKLSALGVAGVFAGFIFLCDWFPMLITWLKWKGEPLSVLGYSGVFNNFQFLVKYMLLQCVFAALLPWAAAFFSLFSAEDAFDRLIEGLAGKLAAKARERQESREQESRGTEEAERPEVESREAEEAVETPVDVELGEIGETAVAGHDEGEANE
jgi:hypothetical protein